MNLPSPILLIEVSRLPWKFASVHPGTVAALVKRVGLGTEELMALFSVASVNHVSALVTRKPVMTSQENV